MSHSPEQGFGRFSPKVRDLLFGDVTISEFAKNSPSATAVEPWNSFQQVRLSLDSRDPRTAQKVLQGILQTPDLESRHYLQAWYYLRSLGVHPPPQKQKELLGVVIEVGINDGLDLLAAYSDHRARYYNYSGKSIIWERPDASLDPTIDKLFTASQRALNGIGPWTDPRPPAPPRDHARVNFLTPNGLYFGQGPLQALMKDSTGGPVLETGAALMQALIKTSRCLSTII